MCAMRYNEIYAKCDITRTQNARQELQKAKSTSSVLNNPHFVTRVHSTPTAALSSVECRTYEFRHSSPQKAGNKALLQVKCNYFYEKALLMTFTMRCGILKNC